MAESHEFLGSLEHTNPARPRFAIKRGVYPMLEITHDGQQLQVPMAEVLEFAHRWHADRESQRAARQSAGGLDLFPYPLMSVSFNDPDVQGLAWD